MHTLAYTIIATIIVSLLSLLGIITLILNRKVLKKILLLLVGLSAGAMLGGAFFHLIPESLIRCNIENLMLNVLIGFVLFLIIEKILHWRHCHKDDCEVHTFAHMNLIGDAAHNFIDGLIIASAFVADFHLGIVTTIAVALHEIPQEIGDFGVLVHGGYKTKKALMLNFGIALTAILGGIIGFFIADQTEMALNFLLPFAAGGFLYIAASDLIPEIRKEKNTLKSTLSLTVFLVGIALMYLLKFLMG